MAYKPLVIMARVQYVTLFRSLGCLPYYQWIFFNFIVLQEQIDVNTKTKAAQNEKTVAINSYGTKIIRNLKFMSSTEVLSKSSEAIGFITSAVSKFLSVDYSNMTSDDTVTIISGCLDICSCIATFLPPPASIITESLSNLVNIFLPGTSVPSNTDVINTLDTKFAEQENFIRNAFNEQKSYIARMFDALEGYNEDLFNKEFLREMKTDGLALLEMIQEKYDYILPHANSELTVDQALDLDQHGDVLGSTYEAARIKYAFSDRCPEVFDADKIPSDTDVKTRQLCSLLLETHLEIEKFRDITLAQLIVILDKTELKTLNEGYLLAMLDRKEKVKTFIETYIIQGNDLFCHLFMPSDFLINDPWYTTESRENVEDYLNHISYDTKTALASVRDECEVNRHVNSIQYTENSEPPEGWSFSVENGIGFTKSDEIEIPTQCSDTTGWYGWSDSRGFIYTSLFSAEEYNSGELNKCGLINFSNCGTGGIVKVYLNEILVSDADPEEKYSDFEFPINETGIVLTLENVEYDSAIKFTEFKMVPCQREGNTFLEGCNVIVN